jgi:hypothetical protein
MQYSVYDHGSRLYTYYQDGRTEGTHAGAPSVLASGKIGVPPDAGAWRLPLGAKKVGTGELPRGRIASRGGGPLAAVDLGSPQNMVVAIGVGYLAYLAWRKWR